MLPELTAVAGDPLLVVGVWPSAGLATVCGGLPMFLHSVTPCDKILEDFVGVVVVSPNLDSKLVV